ncbi:MAG: nicotinamide-nucleotide amidohydrolase family protein [Alphaproteobacteria bacterium]|nr:nicotinamide-nucleotide amidohydrolase family protein [Alphaproteobacteria bacterium]
MSLYPPALTELATAVLDAARKNNLRIATAESCTGGLIMGCLTEIPGSSDVLDRGFITYSYDSKTALLGVDRDLLEKSGAVSSEIALQMAQGALKASGADIVVAATGIAGPGGATENKPVGLVYLGVANAKTGQSYALKNIFGGDRSTVRLETVETALDILLKEARGG